MSSTRYYPQIDALRAIAALGIVLLHWLGERYLLSYGIQSKFSLSFANYGVQLFFVISGFLITEILQDLPIEHRWNSIKNFLARRALRLFPVYFFFIAYLYLLGDLFLVNNLTWYLTYTVNFLLYMSGGLIDIWSNHLWSLSIEEQFYVVFPFLLLFTTRKSVWLIPISIIVVSIVFKVFYVCDHEEIKHLLTPSQLDMIGVGVLIAILKKNRFTLFEKLTQRKGKILALILFMCALIVFQVKNQTLETYTHLLLLFPFGFLVAKASAGFKGYAKKILEWPLMVHLGKVSYGLYIYHKIIPLIVIVFLKKMGIQSTNLGVYFIVNGLVLIVVTELSWWFLESPILSLKKYFPMKHASGSTGV